MNISIRSRITLWYALTVPALLFALAFTAHRIVVGDLRTSLDGALQDRANLVTRAITDNTVPRPTITVGFLGRFVSEPAGSLPLFLRFVDARSGRIITSGSVPAPLAADINAYVRDPSPTEGTFHTLRLKDVDALRVYVSPVRDPETGALIGVLETGESMVSIIHAEKSLMYLSVMEGITGSTVLLVAGFLILRSGLRPMDRILTRLRHMGDRDLAQGLPAEPRPPEIQELVASLNEMWKRLDDAFKARTRLIADVSHELRTPLAALLAQTDVALMSGNLDAATAKTLTDMRSEIRRLVRLTNNLMRNAELESHPALEFEPVDVRELAEEVAGDLWALARGRTMSVDGGPETWVTGNRDLLKEMLVNLVDNAIKSTPEGGQIAISWRLDGGAAELAVSDTGCGIPPDVIRRVGQPFTKGHRPVGALVNGSGLGLSIVHHIAELHQGHITFGPRPGGGTIVTVRLPGNAGSRRASGPNPAEYENASRAVAASAPVQS